MNLAYDYEQEDIDTDLYQHEDDTDLDQEPKYCCARSPCSNCMDCLGLSWRDFM